MRIGRIVFCIGGVFLLAGCGGSRQVQRLPLAEYQDRVYASWLGQCIGNIYGLPHEFKYNDLPRTEPITGWEPKSLEMMTQNGGAFSDDDTDIEYVMLHCMEACGPEPTYEQVAAFWKRHINNSIWVANRAARDLMTQGYLPPLTGRKGLNEHWYQIDPQLVCEIWAATTPGMLDYAAAKADWAAKVTNDDYGTHPTIWYNTLYAAAFFESDVSRLCEIGYQHLPAGSIFREAIDDVRRWKAELGDDWVGVRARIKAKYHDRIGLAPEIATSHVGALLNGALGVLALLYGEGDFERTMNLACMAGYDADNQCATLAGLIGIIHGTAGLPRKYTHPIEEWELPLNDFYKNRTRDELPDGKLTDIARRTAAMGCKLIELHGGRIEKSARGEVLIIPTTAKFTPPLEIRLFPVRVRVDEPARITAEIVGGDPLASVDVVLAGSPPAGMKFELDHGRQVLTGTPHRVGVYPISASVHDGRTARSTILEIHVDAPPPATTSATP